MNAARRSRAASAVAGLRIRAVVAGFALVLLGTIGTDALLHASGLYPGWQRPLTSYQWAVALATRVLWSVAGAWLAASLGASRPRLHALCVGGLVLATSAIVVAAHGAPGPLYGPAWFALAWVASAMPSAWVGASLHAGIARGAEQRRPR